VVPEVAVLVAVEEALEVCLVAALAERAMLVL
jgi:hypothetical protein